MRDRYDIVIVGAGPAGASAAFYAARAGLTTLLLDRKTFPRPKVCGDGLTPRALRALARMGLDGLFSRFQRIDGLRVRDGKRTPEYRYASKSEPSDFGLVIPRVILDAEIVTAAVAGGAELVCASALDILSAVDGGVEGVVVESGTRRVRVRGTVTIAADGATGRVGRLLTGVVHRPQTSGVAARRYFTNIDSPSRYFEVHLPLRVGGDVFEGYGWIFPVSPTEANIGVGLLERPANKAVSITAMYDAFIASLARRDRRVANARPIGPVEGGTLPVRAIDQRCLPHRALLAGDAGGLVNPYTGEGIAYALESGELAAAAVVRALSVGGDPREVYARQISRRFRRLWSLRDQPRHLRWLCTAGDSTRNPRLTAPLARAARSLALDHQARQPTAATRRLRVAHRLKKCVVEGVIRRMRRTDVVLADVVRSLLYDGSSEALCPIVVASLVARDGRADRELINACIALSMFVLAQELTAMVHDSRTTCHGDDAAAITLADCLLTEAVGMLSALPDLTAAAVTHASRRSASARVDLAQSLRSGQVGRDCLDHIAAPSVCVALLAMKRATIGARDLVDWCAFARWYSATRYATNRLRWQPHSAMAPRLSELLDSDTRPFSADLGARDLTVQLRKEAARLLRTSLKVPDRRTAVL